MSNIDSPQQLTSSDEALRDRLFQRTLHEDGIFNERLNFFLVFESLLLTGVAALYSAAQRPSPKWFASFGVLGVAVTLVWAYAQWRQLVLLRTLVDQLEEVAPEVKRTRIVARGSHRGPRIGSVLAYAIPSLLFIVWTSITIVALIYR